MGKIISIIILILSATSLYAQLSLEGYNKVADSGVLRLYFNSSETSIAVEDTRTGFFWSSRLSPDSYKQEDFTKYWLNNFKSLFLLTYTDLTIESNKVKTHSINQLEPGVTVNEIENGISLFFDLTSLNIQLTMNISISGDQLLVSIPDEGIKETVSIDIMVEDIVAELNNQFELLKGLFDDADNSFSHGSINRKKGGVKTSIRLLKHNLSKFDGVNELRYHTEDSYFYLLDIKKRISGTSGAKSIIRELGSLKDNPDALEAIEIYRRMSDLCRNMIVSIGKMKEVYAAGIVSISILPFFGAATNSEDGYVFYPDGSGAITYFSGGNNEWNQFYSKDIYSNDGINIEKSLFQSSQGLKKVLLPLYGINKGKSGFIGVVKEGAENAFINYYPGGYQIPVHRADISFRYRREYDATGTSHNFGANDLARAHRTAIIQKNRIPGDKEILYIFLPENQSDYSGMAVRYREYLINKGLLIKRIDKDENLPLAVDFLGGILEPGMLRDKYIPMTSFSQMAGIVSDLEDSGIDNMKIGVYGWMRNGHLRYPTDAEPDSRLGGYSGIKNLTEYIKDSGNDLYLHQNLVDVNRKSGRFTFAVDTVRNYNQIQESNRYRELFILNPFYIKGDFEDYTLGKFSKISNPGIMFQNLGSNIYYDYHKDHPAIKGDTLNIWNNIFKKASETVRVAAMEAAEYSFPYLDMIYNAPMEATGYFYTDESVPFYQMVLYGNIPYSSDAFNLFYNYHYQKLKAVEYGCIPYFFITSESVDNLKYTEFRELFSPEYKDWEQDIKIAWNELNNRLAGIWGETMMNHNKINRDLVEIKYSNKSKIYINYSDKTMNHNNIIIPPMDFIVLKGDIND